MSPVTSGFRGFAEHNCVISRWRSTATFIYLHGHCITRLFRVLFKTADQWDRGGRERTRAEGVHVMSCNGEGDTRDSLSIAYIDLAKKGVFAG